MTTDSSISSRHARAVKTKRQRRAIGSSGQEQKPRTVIEVERSGDWMPVEELRETALAALGEGRDLAVNLGGVNHLNASALQVLLALGAEQKMRGLDLELTNASPQIRQWFEFAGAAERFFTNGASQQ